MAYDLIPYNSSDFMSYPSGRGMIFLYNLSRGSFWNLLGGIIFVGSIFDWGLYPRGFIYTSAVHLYLRSIFTAPRVLVLRRCSTLYLPLDYELREISYDTNKYSNTFQSREIIVLDLGLDLIGD
jgi:hypothetical protein